jgi:hypothetical protein
MIDGLWATQLFREPRAVGRLIRLYEEHRQALEAGLRRLRHLTLENDPVAVQDTAARMLGTLLDPATGHEHYSFAAKLFHWHAPEHLPIVDSLARRVINSLQRACGQSRGIVLSDTAALERGECVHEYGRWIAFYSELIRGLAPDDREALLEADKESLPVQFARENTLLRILDKVFYRRGRERKAAGETA